MTQPPTVPDDRPAAAAAGQPLVVLSGVNKHYGANHVLRDIDLT
ncbi:MAG: amino acid ABC transporter ATP-binding protein, partial [Catenulispora sp.]|nr:amino acid ABC transporter ATP-binding protein [Catenulispora sp.]